jgi:hypothetical protein
MIDATENILKVIQQEDPSFKKPARRMSFSI